MEKAAEHGSAIAAAVEGVERQWGSNFSGQLIISFGLEAIWNDIFLNGNFAPQLCMHV